MSVTVYDNGGETFDRYTVFFHGTDLVLGIGDTGNRPNGFCMHVEAVEGDHLGEEIDLAEMTDAARRAVEAELRAIEREIRERLEYLRGQLRAERISWGELLELQGLAPHIDAGDVELLEAAGVPEFDDPENV